MPATKRIEGPSPEAVERLNTVLACLFDQDRPMTEAQIRHTLSEHMSQSDARAALRRLRGARMIELAPLEESEKPWQWRCTKYGKSVAERRILEKGIGY